jgi:hypothetical protein
VRDPDGLIARLADEHLRQQARPAAEAPNAVVPQQLVGARLAGAGGVDEAEPGAVRVAATGQVGGFLDVEHRGPDLFDENDVARRRARAAQVGRAIGQAAGLAELADEPAEQVGVDAANGGACRNGRKTIGGAQEAPPIAAPAAVSGSGIGCGV